MRRFAEVIMKTMFLTILTIFGLAAMVMASDPEELVVRKGDQKMTSRGKITVKFVEIVEDSRCPPDVNCVWAGNAKIKVTLSKGRKAAKTFELNSALNPRAIVFEGYDISLIDLTPRPGQKVKMVAMPPSATISITKHVK